MYIIEADFIITCNKKEKILEKKAIYFDEKIKNIDNINILKTKYPKAKIIKTNKNSIILPGLINTHIHLEFSANKTTLKYGNFIKWLYSVIKNTQNTITNATKDTIDKSINRLLSTGTTTIGAISSFALDLDSLIKSNLKVVYFNEAIAPREEMIKNSFDDLKKRFQNSLLYKNDTFIPSIAIHSPYSIHPKMLDLLIEYIKDKDIITSCHFLESKDEKNWLSTVENNFEELLDRKSTLNSIEFLEKLKRLKHILLTHNNYIEKEEYDYIKQNTNFFMTTCPMSNRLLGNKKADIKYLKDINSAIGTDGLSSNISLSMFDELRYALCIYNDIDIHKLAQDLIYFATTNGAKALRLNSGEISINKSADFIVVQLPDICEKDDVILHTILHTKEVQKSFINGKLVYAK
jgi:cytosine/adenosine deaminase-related metal-dependent hydrolase